MLHLKKKSNLRLFDDDVMQEEEKECYFGSASPDNSACVPVVTNCIRVPELYHGVFVRGHENCFKI